MKSSALCEIVADQDHTDMRSDTIISALGFGETKVGDVSTTKQAVNLDIFLIRYHLQAYHRKTQSTGLFPLYDRWIYYFVFYYIHSSLYHHDSLYLAGLCSFIVQFSHLYNSQKSWSLCSSKLLFLVALCLKWTKCCHRYHPSKRTR